MGIHEGGCRVIIAPVVNRDMLSEKRYRIVYQVVGDCVFVDDIQDCRQDVDKSRLVP